MTFEKLEEIKNFVAVNMSDEHHDFYHLDRVRENAVKFASILGISERIDLNLLQAICYLHDATFINHKITPYSYFFEAQIVKRELNKLFPKFKINQEEAEIIMNASVKHPHSFPFRHLNKNNDLYTKLLQDSDTADFFHQKRVAIAKKRVMKIFWLGKILSRLIDKITGSGIKNLKQYLNFPELSDKIDAVN